MRAVLQRVTRARVLVGGDVTGEIGPGLVVLIAVGREDTAATASSMAEKIVNLRIFGDEQGKMNRSLLDAEGSVLAVSQFTLYGDARGQRRPSFIQAAPPEQGKALYEEFVRALQAAGSDRRNWRFSDAHVGRDRERRPGHHSARFRQTFLSGYRDAD